jgi:hypothetical protein
MPFIRHSNFFYFCSHIDLGNIKKMRIFSEQWYEYIENRALITHSLELSINQYAIKRLFQKSKNLNRKERKDFTQRTQGFEFKELSLCAPCENPLRPLR